MDLDPHFGTNDFEAFVLTHNIGYHHMDVVVVAVVIVVVVIVVFIVVLGLGDAVFEVVVNLESISGQNWILTP